METPTTSPPPHTTAVPANVLLGIKLFAGMLIMAAPIYLAETWIPGLSKVAFFGVLAATFGWISGGPKVGFAVAFALSILGSTVILLRDSLWALALILLLLGVAYGYAASKGIGKAFVQLPILTPYFIMLPPPLFADPPTIDARYIIGVLVIMNLTAAWVVLVFRLAIGQRSLTPVHVSDPRVPIIIGTAMGLCAALVMMLSASTGLKSHWVWVTLTLYLLTDPLHTRIGKQLLGRIAGTFAGFVVVALISQLSLPAVAWQILAVLALWLCLFMLVLKREYWHYTLFLTVAVVLLNSHDMNRLLLDAERMGFTIIGAAFSIAIVLLARWIRSWGPPQPQHT